MRRERRVSVQKYLLELGQTQWVDRYHTYWMENVLCNCGITYKSDLVLTWHLRQTFRFFPKLEYPPWLTGWKGSWRNLLRQRWYPVRNAAEQLCRRWFRRCWLYRKYWLEWQKMCRKILIKKRWWDDGKKSGSKQQGVTEMVTWTWQWYDY